MIKIEYPKDKEKKEFEKDYLEVFNLDEDKWNDLKESMKCETRKLLTLKKVINAKDLLTLPFADLLDIYEDFIKHKYDLKVDNKTNKNNYQEIFDYDNLQPKIAKFFMNNSKCLNLKTCYFCNIDYINAFDTNFDKIEYNTIYDILNSKNYRHLLLLQGISEKIAKTIEQRTELINNEDELKKIKVSGKSLGKNAIKIIDNNKNISKIDFHEKANHFTLDHFLPKAKCPLLALSLYNFVPSCYACNSKFKKEEELGDTRLSPTSKDFTVDTDIKFKFFLEGDLSDKKFKLELTHSDISKEYVNTFKLKGRYAIHQDIAEEIIEKQENYSESQIKEMADILKMSSEQIKKDIFGKELFEGDVQEKSFTKLKRDIFNQGIL